MCDGTIQVSVARPVQWRVLAAFKRGDERALDLWCNDVTITPFDTVPCLGTDDIKRSFEGPPLLNLDYL